MKMKIYIYNYSILKSDITQQPFLIHANQEKSQWNHNSIIKVLYKNGIATRESISFQTQKACSENFTVHFQVSEKPPSSHTVGGKNLGSSHRKGI